MLETKADVNENVMSALTGIVNDEGHWVTINGNNVLINEKGEVQSGLGGRLNGVKLSKFKGRPTGGQLKEAKSKADAELKNAQEDAAKKRDEFYQKNGYYALKNQLKSDNGDLTASERNKMRAKVRRLENKAREMFDPEVQRIDKAWNRQRDLARATSPYSRDYTGEKNLKHRNLSAEKASAEAKQKGINEGFERRRTDLKAKARNAVEKYNAMAERVKKAEIGQSSGGWNDFADTIQRRGREKAQQYRQEEANLEGRAFANKRKLEGNLKQINEKLEPAKKTLESGRAKLKSAREANEFVKKQAKGTRVSKATPDMVGGVINKPKEDIKFASEWKKGLEKSLTRTKDKDSNELTQNQLDLTNEYINRRNRVDSAAKATLEKARPRIEARRQAVKAFNERNAPKETSSKVLTTFDKDMAKAEKSYEDFKDVMNRRKNEIDVLRERLRTTKNGFIAKATAQDLEKRIKEYNELDEMY